MIETSIDISKIRNIAIIAHVDHGKTTLIDGLLRQTDTVASHKKMQERAMDSNDLERERGITILSKCTSIRYRDHRINVVDTPGHADFGGEVERVLKMVDCVLLLVDAFEGPMPQTKFVLNKALRLGLRPIVVINKIDRPDSRPDEVLDLVFDLFGDLEADDDQLEFQTVYASAKHGYAGHELEDVQGDIEDLDLTPLLDAVIDHVPHPRGSVDDPFCFQVATLDYSDYLGRLAIGRMYGGTVSKNDRVLMCRVDGSQDYCKVSQVLGFDGLERIELAAGQAGDIVVLAGLEAALPGETACHPEHPKKLDAIEIDEPTITMRFSVNNSPFAGQDGKYLTSRQIKARLDREQEHNVSLRVEETETPEAFQVSGRGELHLAILIEQMRREGYELGVGRPQVIIREEDGKRTEPIEELIVNVPEEFSGTVIDKLSQRKGQMQEMKMNADSTIRLRFLVPSRGLIGLRNEFLTDTRGTGVMYHNFDHYGPYRGETPRRKHGALIAQDKGETTIYALFNLQERGVLFMGATEPVYGGQVIGLNARENDLIVNPCKRKHLTNVRASGSDDAQRLTPPRTQDLESALELIQDDELVEVTPKGIRIRKTILEHSMRKRAEKSMKSGA